MAKAPYQTTSKLAAAAILSAILYGVHLLFPATVPMPIVLGPVALVVAAALGLPAILFLMVIVLTVVEKLVRWKSYSWEHLGRDFRDDMRFISREAVRVVKEDVKKIPQFPRWVLDRLRN